MTTHRLGIRIKSASGRYLTDAGRCAIRLERALLSRPLAEIAARYGVHFKLVSRLVAGLPRYDGHKIEVQECIEAVRRAWASEDSAYGLPVFRADAVMADALALALDDPSLSSAAVVADSLRRVGARITPNPEIARVA